MGGMVTVADTSWLRAFSGAGGVPPTARQLYQAFTLLLFEVSDDDARAYRLSYLAGFTERWGTLSPDRLLALARHFAPGQPRSEVAAVERDDLVYYGPETSEETDTLFILAILAMLRTPETPSVLLPYLASPYAIERWLAAFGLVMMRDEHVLPSLERMLTEFVGPMQPWTLQGGSPENFRLWRHELLRLLADWGDPRVVPPIRAGLIATVHTEEDEVPDPHGMEQQWVWKKDHMEQEFVWCGERFTESEAWKRFHGKRMDWVDEEHLFVYALGQLGAFGALEGVPTRSGVYYWRPIWTDDGRGGDVLEEQVPESHADKFRANVWRVHLCFGALESRFRGQLKSIFHLSNAPELAEAVEQLLAGKFGMDESTRRRAMEDYDQASYVAATMFDYQRFAEQAQEEAEEVEEMEEQARDE